MYFFSLHKYSNSVYIINMKDTKQLDIADFLDVSPQMLCDVKAQRRYFSKANAKHISDKTGIPFETVALCNGDFLYKRIVSAYKENSEE